MADSRTVEDKTVIPVPSQNESSPGNLPNPLPPLPVAAWASLSPLSTTDTQLPVIPDHELIRVIGQGAYGEVWLARNAVGTWRAVKIVCRDRHDSAESFEREFKGLQKFEPVSRAHAGLVDILTLGLLPEGAGFYYVMELADGVSEGDGVSVLGSGEFPRDPRTQTQDPSGYAPRTLRFDLKSRGALPADEVIALGLKLTAALAHLHAQGLVHRDVKPANIIFVSGEPKLADAGLVAAVDDAHSLVGTAGYIAPEGPGTPQADLYALGKVLYEAAFGKDRQDFPQLPPDLASRPDHARLLELNAILLKACATDARKRYESTGDLRADLELLQRGKSVKRQRALQRVSTVCKKAGLAAVILALVVIGILRFTRDDSDKYTKSLKAEVNNLVQQGHDHIRFETHAQFAEAARKFKRAIKLDPTYVPAYVGLYHAYYRLGDNQGMRKMTQKLVELAPDSAEARGAVASAEWENWHFQEAIELARQSTVLRALSKEGDAYKHLEYGYFLQEAGDSTNALRQYKIAQKLLPNDPIILDHLGQPYLMQRNYAEAEKHFRRSIVQQQDHGNGHWFLAETYEQTGRFEEAIAEWEICRRLSGDKEPEIQRYFGGLRDALRTRGARSYWQKKLEEAQKESPPRLYYMATLYARLGEKDKAYALLEQAFKQHDSGAPMLDLCWDHDDPKFKTLVKGIGLIR